MATGDVYTTYDNLNSYTTTTNATDSGWTTTIDANIILDNSMPINNWSGQTYNPMTEEQLRVALDLAVKQRLEQEGIKELDTNKSLKSIIMKRMKSC